MNHPDIPFRLIWKWGSASPTPGKDRPFRIWFRSTPFPDSLKKKTVWALCIEIFQWNHLVFRMSQIGQTQRNNIVFCFFLKPKLQITVWETQISPSCVGWIIFCMCVFHVIFGLFSLQLQHYFSRLGSSVWPRFSSGTFD